MDQEALATELSVCKRKLQSKEEALRILKSELDNEREQKEHYKHVISIMVGGGKNGATQLEELSMEDITVILSEKDDKIKLLEEKMKELKSLQEKNVSGEYSVSLLQELLSQRTHWNEEKQELIHQLEISTQQVSKLETQVHTLEDDKEELVAEKTFVTTQCSKLTAELECINSAKQSVVESSDVAGKLLAENRQLKIQLTDAELERDKALSKIERYKRAVERRKQQESQGVQFKMLDKKGETLHRVQELESLANALSETVKEKNIALDLQRKANRALAGKISELEHKIYLMELVHVTDSIKKDCHTKDITASEALPIDREADQVLDNLQVLNHNDTTEVV